jgi:hypothetical protein
MSWRVEDYNYILSRMEVVGTSHNLIMLNYKCNIIEITDKIHAEEDAASILSNFLQRLSSCEFKMVKQRIDRPQAVVYISS